MISYTEEIWEDLTYDEKQAYHIAEAFQKRTNKRGNRKKWIPSASAKTYYIPDRDEKYPGDKIRESKNFQYFLEVWEVFKDFPQFDAEIFMDSVFRNLPGDKKIFPAQLRTKKVVQQYKDYRQKLKMTDKVSDDKQIMESFATSYKYIQKRLQKNTLTFQDTYNFFNLTEDNNILSDGLKAAILEMLSPFYLAISKSFEHAFLNTDQDIRDEIMTMQRLQHLRARVKLKPKVYQFAKTLFGEDVV